MRDVAERVIDGSLRPPEPHPAVRFARWRAAPARRQLAHLPGLLRPAHRHGHGQRARSPTRSSASRRCSSTCSRTTSPTACGGVRPSRADVPPRAGRRLQGRPGRGARHPAPADGSGAPGRRGAGSRSLELAGFEADDIIATLATEQGPGRRRPDRHRRPRQLPAGRGPACQGALQPAGRQRLRAVRRGGHPGERTGVTPAHYPEYAALRGDTSDNLPGVPGVGEKTAAKLINTYGGLDGIFAHVDAQTPKLRASLIEHEPRARQNHELMILDCTPRSDRSRRPHLRPRSGPRSIGSSSSSSSASCSIGSTPAGACR